MTAKAADALRAARSFGAGRPTPRPLPLMNSRRNLEDRSGADPALEPLTEVELVWHEGRLERWLRFGRWRTERILDRSTRVVAFEPGAVFAFIRWQSNGFGTVLSRIDILEAVLPATSLASVPGVRPGAAILLRLDGWPRVMQALQAIDAVEALGIDPAEVAPDHWRHVHNRLAAGEPPRAYSRARHRAWLMRRRIAP